MQDSEEMRKFLNDYKAYMENVLKPTSEEVELLFKRWKEPDYW